MFWFKTNPLSHLSQWEQDIIAHLKCYKLQKLSELVDQTYISFLLSNDSKLQMIIFKHHTDKYADLFNKKTMETELWVVQISDALFDEVLNLSKTTMIASIKPPYQWDKVLTETFEDMEAIQDAANNIASLTRSVEQIKNKPR